MRKLHSPQGIIPDPPFIPAGSYGQPVRVVFHNALHDLPILEELGVYVDPAQAEDTMLMSFCLGTLPLGLKPLSRRLLGAQQNSFEETIRPAERRLSLEYIKQALTLNECPRCHGTGKQQMLRVDGKGFTKPVKCLATGCTDGYLWPSTAPRIVWDWKTGSWKSSQPWSIAKYLQRLRQDIEAGKFDQASTDDEDAEQELSDEDETGQRTARTVRQRWHGIDEDIRQPVEDAFGPMPEATLDDIPEDVANHYSARDADLTYRIYPKLKALLKSNDLTAAYKLDLSVIPWAAEMQRNGMRINVPKMQALSKRFQREQRDIAHQLRGITGRYINPGSGDQVADLLFGSRGLSFTEDDAREITPHFSLELSHEKRTSSGKRAATDEKVLEGLKLKYAGREDVTAIVQHILDYRTRQKLDSFAVKLASMVDSASRVHTRLKLTTAATYRLASAEPNLQNIPIRNKGGADLGRLIRECFEANPGWCLGSADYSQVELRVLAALSGDDSLLEAFRTGLDPHVLGASRAWRIPYEEIDKGRKTNKKYKDMRDSAKNLNFGIVFGITPRGLQAQMELRGLHYTLDECADLIRMWIHETFPGIGQYIAEVHAEAKQHGFVRSFGGHIRHCPGVWSLIPAVREEALRQAVNFTIQATAAEIMKHGIGAVWQRGKRILDDAEALMLMSVHDELLTEQPDTDEARDLVALSVETYMTDPIQLPNGVRIETDIKFASDWGTLKAA